MTSVLEETDCPPLGTEQGLTAGLNPGCQVTPQPRYPCCASDPSATSQKGPRAASCMAGSKPPRLWGPGPAGLQMLMRGLTAEGTAAPVLFDLFTHMQDGWQTD